MVPRLTAMAEQAAAFPLAGRIVPEYERPDLRERIVENYRLIYRLKHDVVEVAAVIPGSRQLGRLRRDF